jgi:hypothetical protein
MSVTTIAHPVTVRALLFGSDEDSVAAITRVLSEDGVLDEVKRTIQKLPTAGRGRVMRELATLIRDLLALDVGDLLLAAWRTRAKLIDAAQRTRAKPGSRALVALATHRVTQIHRPYIDMLFNGRRLHRIEFELSLIFDVHALVGVIRDGRLIELHSGSCDAACSLLIDGCRRERKARLELPLAVRLGSGVPLLPDDTRAIPP